MNATTTTLVGPVFDKQKDTDVLVCVICGRIPSSPYRVLVDGQLYAGCVAAAHNDYADAWHMTPYAVSRRAAKNPAFSDVLWAAAEKVV